MKFLRPQKTLSPNLMGALKNLDITPIINKYNARVFVELGAGYGTGIFHAICNLPIGNVLSVEIDAEQAELLQKFFRFDNRVQVFQGLSRDFLDNVLPKIPLNVPCLIFCDSHYPSADFGKKGFKDEKDENIRMPLVQELELILKHRVSKGAKDVILIDDISLYDESDRAYAHDHKKSERAKELAPILHQNFLPKFIEWFAPTHDYQIFPQEQGWIAFLPR